MYQLKATFEGLRVVLIGDVHEQPMLHLKIKPFNITVRDWSGDVCYPASRCCGYVLTGPATAARDNHAGDPHRLLEPDKLALGAL